MHPSKNKELKACSILPFFVCLEMSKRGSGCPLRKRWFSAAENGRWFCRPGICGQVIRPLCKTDRCDLLSGQTSLSTVFFSNTFSRRHSHYENCWQCLAGSLFLESELFSHVSGLNSPFFPLSCSESSSQGSWRPMKAAASLVLLPRPHLYVALMDTTTLLR